MSSGQVKRLTIGDERLAWVKMWTMRQLPDGKEFVRTLTTSPGVYRISMPTASRCMSARPAI